MKKIIMIIFFISIMPLYSQLNTEYKVITSDNSNEERLQKLNINTSTYDEMIKRGIRKNIVLKLIEYREITGGFEKISDMKRINGIGKGIYEKIKGKFETPRNVKLKRFNINNSDDTILIYYGFSKNEIKKIREFQLKKRITNNLELKRLISKTKYDKIKDCIDY